MEEYYLSNLSKDESGANQIDRGPQMSQQEYVELLNAFEFTGFYHICRSIKNMTIESGTDLEEFLCALQHSTKPLYESEVEKQLTTANKLLINFLSFIRTFIDVTRHSISQRSATDLDSFSDLNSALYDGIFGYRFFTRMRNYVVHYTMPLTILEDLAYSGAMIYCDRDNLLQYNGWSTVRKEIEKLPEAIDITPYIAEAKVAISALYLKSLETIVLSAAEAEKKISEIREKNKITSPVIVVINDDKSISIRMLPLHLLGEFFIDLKDHPSYKIEIN